jgi:hypothetical protein
MSDQRPCSSGFIWVKYGGRGSGFSPLSLLDRLSILERREEGMSKICRVVVGLRSSLYVFVRVEWRVGSRGVRSPRTAFACVTGRARCCSRDSTVVLCKGVAGT